jgi:DNA-binding MarR family transcriptional regulator
MQHDWVDGVLADWARECPDLDTAPARIVARVGRLATFLDAGMGRIFHSFGISRADYDVLATLRRSGAPYRRPQKELMRALMRTSGTMSFRIDRLERVGLVRREPDPADGRNVFVVLTTEGLDLFNQVAPIHLANEERMIAALSADEREQFIGLLRILLRSLEAAGTDE